MLGYDETRRCDTVFTNGSCGGHFGGKFADCKTEGLYTLALENLQDDLTGSCDYEGHLTMFLMEQTGGADLNGDGRQLVLIPPGNYILFESPNGSVSLWEYENKKLAVEELERWDQRYERWIEQNDY